MPHFFYSVDPSWASSQNWPHGFVKYFSIFFAQLFFFVADPPPSCKAKELLAEQVDSDSQLCYASTVTHKEHTVGYSDPTIHPLLIYHCHKSVPPDVFDQLRRHCHSADCAVDYSQSRGWHTRITLRGVHNLRSRVLLKILLSEYLCDTV